MCLKRFKQGYTGFSLTKSISFLGKKEIFQRPLKADQSILKFIGLTADQKWR